MRLTTQATAPAPAHFDWLAGYFSQEELGDPNQEPVLWGLDADPEDDGMPNIVEYYMGLHPREVEPTPALTVTVEGGQLRVTFRQAKDSANVEPRFEWSTNLQTWSAEGIAIEVVSESPGFWLKRASVPAGDEARKFIRIQWSWKTGP